MCLEEILNRKEYKNDWLVYGKVPSGFCRKDFFFLTSVLNKRESRQRRRSLPVILNEVLRIILAGDSALRLNVVRYLNANCTVYSHLHSV